MYGSNLPLPTETPKNNVQKRRQSMPTMKRKFKKVA